MAWTVLVDLYHVAFTAFTLLLQDMVLLISRRPLRRVWQEISRAECDAVRGMATQKATPTESPTAENAMA